MKKVAFTAASVAMVAMAASPALAQDDNVVDSFNTDAQYDVNAQNCAPIVGQYSNIVQGGAAAIGGDAAVAEVANSAGVDQSVVINCINGDGNVVGGVAGGGEVADDGGDDGSYGVYSEGESDDTASATYSVLPDTGGASLIALGAGALLVAGGLVARKVIR